LWLVVGSGIIPSAPLLHLVVWTLAGYSTLLVALQVTKGYRTMAGKWHPDKWAGKSDKQQRVAEEMFKKVSEVSRHWGLAAHSPHMPHSLSEHSKADVKEQRMWDSALYIDFGGVRNPQGPREAARVQRRVPRARLD